MDIEQLEVLLEFILKIGIASTAVSVLGLFVPNVNNEQIGSMINAIYLSSLIFGALFSILIIIVLIQKHSSFSDQKLSSLAKRNWRVAYAFRRSTIGLGIKKLFKQFATIF